MNSGLPRYRWVVLAAATLTQMTTAFAFLGVGALAAHFRSEFGLDATRAGLIITAAALAPLLVMIAVGRVLDRRSETVVMSVGSLLLASGLVAVSFAESYWLLLLLLFVGGAGYATSQPGGSKVVAEQFTAAQRGLAMGIRQTGLPLGGAIAAAVLPRLAESRGLGTALRVAALVVVVGAGVFAAVNRSQPRRRVSNRPAARTEIGVLLRRDDFRRLLAVGVVMVAAQLAIIVHLMSFLLESREIALVDGAWVLFTIQGAGVPGRIALAKWSDRARNGRFVPMSAALIGTSVALVTFVAIPASLAAWVVFGSVAGFFTFGWYGPWVVTVSETSPAGSLGMTLAVAMTANQLAIVVAPPLFGLVVDTTGSWTASWVLLAGAIASVAVWLGRRQPLGPADNQDLAS